MTLAFGELRSLLNQPEKDHAWRTSVWKLLDKAYTKDSETYQSQWLPHLLNTPPHFWSESIKYFGDLDELERAHHIAPFALFRFSARVEPLSRILQTPGAHQLDDLSLWIPTIKPGELITLVKTCTRLKSLMLGCCNINEHRKLTPEFLNELVHTQPLAHLKTLNIQSNNLHTAEMEILSQSNNLPALQSLILFENQLDHTSIKAMRDAPWLPQLKFLDLSANGLEADGVEALLEIDNFDHLQDLNLKRNNIRDTGCEILAKSTNLTNLTSLDLSENSIGLYGNNEGIAALSQSTGFPNLESLTFDKNHVKDDGLRHIANAKHFHSLQGLSFDENDIDGPGLLDLAQAPWIKQLQRLSVQVNEYADEYMAFEHYSAFIKAIGEHAQNMTLTIDHEKPEWMYGLEEHHEYGYSFDLNAYNLDDSDYELLSQHPLLKTIKSFSFEETDITTDQLQLLLGSGCLNHVEYLCIDSISMPSNAPEALSQMKHLQELTLCEVQLDDATLATILKKAQWPDLHTLNLGANNLTPQAFQLLNQTELPTLKSLALWGIKCSLADFIQYLQGTPVNHFEELYFDDSIFTHEDVINTSRTEPLHIEYLNLSGCELSDQHIKTLTENLQNIHISYLNLDWNDLGLKGVQHLADCPQLQHTDLSLRGNTILDDGLATIIKSSYLNNLNEMDLRHQGLTPAAFSGLEGITVNWRVISCDIPLDADGFETLFNLCPNLQKLTLYQPCHAAIDVLAKRPSTNIEDLSLIGILNETNIETLLDSPSIHQIKKLYISKSHITLKLAQCLADCHVFDHIETITFFSNNIGEEAKTTLKQSPYLSGKIIGLLW